jgi:hypothetical protein
VAVPTGPGIGNVEGEENDPFRGTVILSIDPDTDNSERVVE